LVDLFGKKKLEDSMRELESQVSKLQEERDGLVLALERKEEKIKRLSSAYQESSLALKSAEKKSLVPSQARTISDQAEDAAARPRGDLLGASAALNVIGKLSAFRSDKEDLITAYLRMPEKELPAEARRLAESVRSDRGTALFHCPRIFTLALVPPFPLEKMAPKLDSAFFVEPLREMMETPVLVISAHAGESFLGVALNKEGFEVKEIVRSQVKEKHSKGGWSQKRFERLREEDIHGHAESVVEKMEEILGKYRLILKYAVISGDQSLLRLIEPSVKLPSVSRKIEKHDKNWQEELLEEAYGFTCYRSCGEAGDRLG
jgi:hypothetical protein